MRNVHLNIILPSSTDEEMNKFIEELNEKKSHIITSALEMYFDYLDIKVAEKGIEKDDGKRYSIDEVFDELGV